VLRHATRSIQHSIYLRLKEYFEDTLGYQPDSIHLQEDLGQSPATRRPQLGQDSKPLVSIFVTNRIHDEETQLGGVNRQATHVLFIDVLSAQLPISSAIADDILELLDGTGSSEYITLYDQATDEEVTDGRLWVESAACDGPDPTRPEWIQVSANILRTYIETRR
jgi:hypothetical protein